MEKDVCVRTSRKYTSACLSGSRAVQKSDRRRLRGIPLQPSFTTCALLAPRQTSPIRLSIIIGLVACIQPYVKHSNCELLQFFYPLSSLISQALVGPANVERVNFSALQRYARPLPYECWLYHSIPPDNSLQTLQTSIAFMRWRNHFGRSPITLWSPGFCCSERFSYRAALTKIIRGNACA